MSLCAYWEFSTISNVNNQKMGECCQGTCWICKSKGYMNILLGSERDYFLTISQKQTNEKITLCNNCFLILLKKQFSKRNRKAVLGNQSATISNTNSSSFSSSSIETIQSSRTNNVRENIQNTANSMSSSSSLPPVSPAISVNRMSSSSNLPPVSPAISVNRMSSSSSLPPVSPAISLNTEEITSSESVATHEPTTTSNQTTSNVNSGAGPGPLSMKRKLIEKPIVHEVSSDEDDDTFDPGIRCPTVQPLIKKRRTPYEPRHFDDEQAPIFDTSNITGG